MMKDVLAKKATPPVGAPVEWKERAAKIIGDFEALRPPDILLKHTQATGVMANFLREIAAAPAAPVAEPHPDDIAVDKFAAAMKAKMAASRARGRGGWDDPAQCDVADLCSMLVDHIDKGDPVDVGNFAMMLFNRGVRSWELPTALAARIAPATKSQPVADQRDLLPCPFCGGTAAIQEHESHTHSAVLKGIGVPDHPGSFTIECIGPGCNTGQIADTRAEVMAMWNRRAAS